MTENDLIREAFDMAKSNLAPVIRCKNCYYWMKAKVTRSDNLVCPKSGMEIVATDFCSKTEKACQEDKRCSSQQGTQAKDWRRCTA